MKVMLNRFSLFFSILVLAGPLYAADRAPEEYLQDLNSDDPLVQMEACRMLGRGEVSAAVGPLINLMQSSGDERVQAHAAAALGAIGEAGPSTEAILRLLDSSDSASVQYAGIAALANLDDSDRKSQILAAIEKVEQDTSGRLVQDLAMRLKPIVQGQ